MSQESYTHEQIEEKLKKALNSQKKRDSVSNKSIPKNLTAGNIKRGQSTKKTLDYEYNHPTNAEIVRMNKTHIHIEKWFASDLSLEKIWEKFMPLLEQSHPEEYKQGTVEEDTNQKKWILTNHLNYKTIITLTKYDRFGNLRILKRVAKWGAAADGILHGSYISLLTYGLIFALFQPSLLISIGTITIVWGLAGFIISRISLKKRKKKQKHLALFANKIINSLAEQSESSNLRGA